jgi:hypothetical protein
MTTTGQVAHNRKIDLHQAVEDRLQGKSMTQIAQEQGVSKSAVSALFKRFGVQRTDVQAFQESRPDLLDSLQSKSLRFINDVLDTMTVKEIRAFTASQKMDALRTGNIVFGTLYDKSRLERGQSTSNSQGLLVLAKAGTDGLAWWQGDVNKLTQPQLHDQAD